MLEGSPLSNAYFDCGEKGSFKIEKRERLSENYSVSFQPLGLKRFLPVNNEKDVERGIEEIEKLLDVATFRYTKTITGNKCKIGAVCPSVEEMDVEFLVGWLEHMRKNTGGSLKIYDSDCYTCIRVEDEFVITSFRDVYDVLMMLKESFRVELENARITYERPVDSLLNQIECEIRKSIERVKENKEDAFFAISLSAFTSIVGGTTGYLFTESIGGFVLGAAGFNALLWGLPPAWERLTKRYEAWKEGRERQRQLLEKTKRKIVAESVEGVDEKRCIFVYSRACVKKEAKKRLSRKP